MTAEEVRYHGDFFRSSDPARHRLGGGADTRRRTAEENPRMPRSRDISQQRRVGGEARSALSQSGAAHQSGRLAP